MIEQTFHRFIIKYLLLCAFFEEIIQDLYAKGYTIITAYWDAENTQTYIDELIGILGNDTMVRSDVLQSWGADLQLLTVVPE